MGSAGWIRGCDRQNSNNLLPSPPITYTQNPCSLVIQTLKHLHDDIILWHNQNRKSISLKMWRVSGDIWLSKVYPLKTRSKRTSQESTQENASDFKRGRGPCNEESKQCLKDGPSPGQQPGDSVLKLYENINNLFQFRKRAWKCILP